MFKYLLFIFLIGINNNIQAIMIIKNLGKIIIGSYVGSVVNYLKFDLIFHKVKLHVKNI